MDVSRAANPPQSYEFQGSTKNPTESDKRIKTNHSKMQEKISLAIFLHEYFVHHFFPRTSPKSKISGSSLNIFSEMVVGFMVMNPMVESVKMAVSKQKHRVRRKFFSHGAPLRLSSFCASTPWG